MIQDMPMDGVSGGTDDPAGGSLTDAIELRLPSRPEYLTLVRAAVGVIAGGMSFNYDEIIQLRVAVSEAVQMTMRTAARERPDSGPAELVVRFAVGPDQLAILILVPEGLTGPIAVEQEVEGLAVLESLVDEVEAGDRTGDQHLIRMIKYKRAAEG